MLANPVFTVGHSNRSFPEFVDVLRSAGIELLIDIRRFPASRRHPHFGVRPLKQELASIDVAYRHFPELGGYRQEPEARSSSPNDAWPPGFLRNYADYALTESFQNSFYRLCQTLQPRSALMCAEKSWKACHRQIIADYLISNGHQIVHLLDAGTREEGKPTPFAMRSAEGTILYPASHPQPQFDF